MNPHLYTEVIPGLADFARREVAGLSGRVELLPERLADALRFTYRGDMRALLGLRSVVAVYLAETFPVPRPRGLLGNQHFARLMGMVETVRGLHPPDEFRTLRLSAAGEGSAVMARLCDQLAGRAELAAADGEGDMLFRLRPAPGGWEALVRLSPRPLTARPWRVCNMPGALNPVVAHAMAAMSAPSLDDRYLNLCCGSGTLLIERLALGPARLAAGCDLDPTALACARWNLEAAGYPGRPLLRADAGLLPFPDASFDVLASDLPFGRLVGTHAGNEQLYPRLLAEATRVAAPGARLLLVTHEVRLLERLLASPPLSAAWETISVLRVTLPFGSGGLNPRIYRLRRKF